MNPSIDDLFDESKFELVTTLEHKKIKEFVFEQIGKRGKLTVIYMVYQMAMVLLGFIFFAYSVYLAIKGNHSFLTYSFLALACSFSVLVVLHELIHGLALKIIGAPKIKYGGYLKKFIFYAEANRFVINRKQFYFVALAPLVLVKLITIAGVILTLGHPAIFFFIILMCLHSLFCAGDIGLMSFFELHKDSEVFTFDNHAEKKSYYFKRNN